VQALYYQWGDAPRWRVDLVLDPVLVEVPEPGWTLGVAPGPSSSTGPANSDNSLVSATRIALFGCTVDGLHWLSQFHALSTKRPYAGCSLRSLRRMVTRSSWMGCCGCLARRRSGRISSPYSVEHRLDKLHRTIGPAPDTLAVSFGPNQQRKGRTEWPSAQTS
jgi:hypothetical protein